MGYYYIHLLILIIGHSSQTFKILSGVLYKKSLGGILGVSWEVLWASYGGIGEKRCWVIRNCLFLMMKNN